MKSEGWKGPEALREAPRAITTSYFQLGPGPTELPVFNTPHSTAYNQAIAETGLVLLTEIGSTMHGVSDDSTGDDLDEMGVCLEPPDEVLGLGTFEQYEYRTQPVNRRSGSGDVDRVVYGLRKFVRLAAAGNPTVLMPLFADEIQHVRFQNAVGRNLRANRDMFVTKRAGHKFLGYLDGQRKRYLDPTRQDFKRASRPELIERYGWDTKTGYHALRLALQGIQLMLYGTITLPMADAHREFLLKVRAGRYSKEWVTDHLDTQLIPGLKIAIDLSTLPEQPDCRRINTWLADTYRRAWDRRGI